MPLAPLLDQPPGTRLALVGEWKTHAYLQPGVVPGAVYEFHAARVDGGVSPGINDPLTTQAFDTSGHAHHGTLCTFAGSEASGYAGTGAPGDPRRLVHDGTSDYVGIADHADLKFGTGPYALETWCYLPDSTGVEKALIAKQSTTAASYPGYSLMLYNNTVRIWAVQNNGAGQARAAISAVLTPGTLYHILGGYDGNECYLYVNGALNVASRLGTAGAYNTDNAKDLRLFSRELSSIYSAGGLAVSRVYPVAPTLVMAQQNYAADVTWGQPVRLALDSEWRTRSLTRLELDSEWRTRSLTRLELDSEWRTRSLTRLTLESEWRTRTAKTQLGLLSEWCTRRILLPQIVRLDLESRWRTLGVPQAVRLNLTGSWKTHTLTRLALGSAWKTVAAARVRLTLESQWKTRALTRLTLTGAWKTERSVASVSLLATFNGIDLNNGVTTHVMAEGNDAGGETPVYDLIRHYDDSLLVHDAHEELTPLSISLLVKFGDAASLGAWLAGLRAACLAGGTLNWQASPTAPLRSFSIAPSPQPKIEEGNAYILQHRAEFELQLTRWPE